MQAVSANNGRIIVAKELIERTEDLDFLLRFGRLSQRYDGGYIVTLYNPQRDYDQMEEIRAYFSADDPVEVCTVTILQDGDKFIFGFASPYAEHYTVTAKGHGSWKDAWRALGTVGDLPGWALTKVRD